MTLDLEQHLKDLCEEHNPRLDLYNRLERVRSSAESIWSEQRLKWFTDHSATKHSRCIINHLSSILRHLQNTFQALNPHELYVLLASCYLHDIGMQDFQSANGRGVEQFTEKDYNRIRKDHPKRSRQLILKRTLRRERDQFNIDLDDDPQYLIPIALVSEGHGSAFFLEKVRELQERDDRPGNMPFRGDLLTALLLMGDELDLHEERATFPQEFAYSPISLLHHHIHHYVKGVEIIDGRTPKHRRIRLTMEFPEDSDEYRAEVQDLIVTKLRKQSELTNPIIERATKGELLWDDMIEIPEPKIDSYGVRRSFMDSEQSKKALYELRRDIKEAQTVNRDGLIEALREGIEQSRKHFQAIQVIDREYSDWGHLAKHLNALCDCNDITLIRRGFLERTGRDPLGVLQYIADKLSNAGFPCYNYGKLKSSMDVSQHNAFNNLGEALLTDIQTCTEEMSLVLLLQHVDKAEYKTLRWLKEWLLPELRNKDVKILLIITHFESIEINEVNGYIRSFRLEDFTHKQIDEYLQLNFGFSPEKSEKKAEEILGFTSGTPLFVYGGLMKEWKPRITLSN